MSGASQAENIQDFNLRLGNLVKEAAPAGYKESKLYVLELGRFLAAFFVVLCHLIPFTSHYAAAGTGTPFGGVHVPGAIGVQYFFVLSGFVMMSAHLKDWGQPAATLRFWWRRACRIYPAYWLALLIPTYYFYHALPLMFGPQLFTLSPWGAKDMVAPAWSLRYEMAFYLAFGLCLVPRLGKYLLAAWVAAALWRWAPAQALIVLHLPPPFFIDRVTAGWGDIFTSFLDYYFFAGLAAGWAHAKLRPGRRASYALFWLGALLLLTALPATNWGDQYGGPMTILWVAVLLAAFMLGLAGLERCGALRFGRFAGFAGSLSYPLYILHVPVMIFLGETLPYLHLSAPALCALLLGELALIYAVAAIVTVVFDQPIQRALRAGGGLLGKAWLRRPARPAWPAARPV